MVLPSAHRAILLLLLLLPVLLLPVLLLLLLLLLPGPVLLVLLLDAGCWWDQSVFVGCDTCCPVVSQHAEPGGAHANKTYSHSQKCAALCCCYAELSLQHILLLWVANIQMVQPSSPLQASAVSAAEIR
jgi:hypothetical protein